MYITTGMYFSFVLTHRKGLYVHVFFVLLQGMKSYQAYQLYPMEVARIQELEEKISGGSTAVVAVVCNDHLYVANVGDSRAVLICEKSNGTLHAEQLSVDHSVENEEELKRLEAIGLNRAVLVKAGRVGSQENTRSFGDYCVKDGYKDVDTLRFVGRYVGCIYTLAIRWWGVNK